ncbi:MAG: exodeoxyribonuclease VII large subunit [Clostridia bacterium]|nr:exodeoxyribonuclease VII large subunit [Clostridia bacterium]
MERNAITVKQLNTFVKNLLEGDVRLASLCVAGEISNFKNHYSSGHWYFTLKDKDAQVRCVMFNSYAARVTVSVEDGMQVCLKGRVSLYERDGQYQFYAEEILPLGEGGLAIAFNKLKEKLQREGLFDAAQKRPLARFPKRIAVITSDTGAAVRDVLNILSKRYPLCEVLLCPVIVQGEAAAGSMIKALDDVYARGDVDTIIIGRGGGSMEDLWAFNDEALARKIFESPIPVISAVGHETDFTICDFVADLRASTPSHAAELAVPDISVLLTSLGEYRTKLSSALVSKYNYSKANYDLIVSKPPLSSPEAYFDNLAMLLDNSAEDIKRAVSERFSGFEIAFRQVVSKIDALSPLKTLSRGFTAVKSGGRVISSVTQLQSGDNINLQFSDGAADAVVTALRSNNE